MSRYYRPFQNYADDINKTYIACPKCGNRGDFCADHHHWECDKCKEPLEIVDDDENDSMWQCQPCEEDGDDKCFKELTEAKSKTLKKETKQEWAKRCNNILKEHGHFQDIEYCEGCKKPTSHDDIFSINPTTHQSETKKTCLTCQLPY